MKQNIEIKKDSYLSFKLNKEFFAVEVKKVLEVLDKQYITRVPKSPEYIKGVISFRGEILPVIETRRKFNMPLIDKDADYVIIILDLIINDKSLQLGAIADGVNDVLEITDDQIKSVPEMGSNYNTEFITGMIKLDNNFIMILNVDKVFSVDEVKLKNKD